jgi:hypothetical protein
MAGKKPRATSYWTDTGDWPRLKRSWCPWCRQGVLGPELVRMHDDAAEYRCCHCGKKHVRKENDLEPHFAFSGDYYFSMGELPPYDETVDYFD